MINGCGKSASTDQATIENLIANDNTYFGTDFLSDQNADTSTQSVETQATSASTPFLWYRVINSATKTISATVASDSTTAEAAVTTTVVGTLYIQKTAAESKVEKPFKDVFSRKAKFEKNNLGIWEVKEITPLSINSSLDLSAVQTVKINSLKISKKNGDAFIEVFKTTDANQFMKVSDIPVFSQSDEIKLEVDVTNSKSDYSPSSSTFLHTWNIIPWRLPMYDDGATKGDVQANDGIFTNTWSLALVTKKTHYAIADSISSEVFEDLTSLNNYNASGFGIHYVVKEEVPPQ
jgi:hypothetical protein